MLYLLCFWFALQQLTISDSFKTLPPQNTQHQQHSHLTLYSTTRIEVTEPSTAITSASTINQLHLILQFVVDYGENWNQISQLMKTKSKFKVTPKQCRAMYFDHIDSSSSLEWTDKQDILLMSLYESNPYLSDPSRYLQLYVDTLKDSYTIISTAYTDSSSIQTNSRFDVQSLFPQPLHQSQSIPQDILQHSKSQFSSIPIQLTNSISNLSVAAPEILNSTFMNSLVSASPSVTIPSTPSIRYFSQWRNISHYLGRPSYDCRKRLYLLKFKIDLDLSSDYWYNWELFQFYLLSRFHCTRDKAISQSTTEGRKRNKNGQTELGRCMGRETMQCFNILKYNRLYAYYSNKFECYNYDSFIKYNNSNNNNSNNNTATKSFLINEFLNITSLPPALRHTLSWSIEEDDLLMGYVMKYGTKWTKISSLLAVHNYHRTHAVCYARYHVLLASSYNQSSSSSSVLNEYLMKGPDTGMEFSTSRDSCRRSNENEMMNRVEFNLNISINAAAINDSIISSAITHSDNDEIIPFRYKRNPSSSMRSRSLWAKEKIQQLCALVPIYGSDWKTITQILQHGDPSKNCCHSNNDIDIRSLNSDGGGLDYGPFTVQRVRAAYMRQVVKHPELYLVPTSKRAKARFVKFDNNTGYNILNSDNMISNSDSLISAHKWKHEVNDRTDNDDRKSSNNNSYNNSNNRNNEFENTPISQQQTRHMMDLRHVMLNSKQMNERKVKGDIMNSVINGKTISNNNNNNRRRRVGTGGIQLERKGRKRNNDDDDNYTDHEEEGEENDDDDGMHVALDNNHNHNVDELSTTLNLKWTRQQDCLLKSLIEKPIQKQKLIKRATTTDTTATITNTSKNILFVEEKAITNDQWVEIAEHMNRSPEDIMLRYDFKLNRRNKNGIKQGQWTRKDDQTLLAYVLQQNHNNNNNYNKTSTLVSLSMTNTASIINPDIVDANLDSSSSVMNDISWSKIGEILHRSGAQCALRYKVSLDPRLKWKLWTADEDARLICLRQERGYNWVMISAALDRASASCRYRYIKLTRTNNNSNNNKYNTT